MPKKPTYKELEQQVQEIEQAEFERKRLRNDSRRQEKQLRLIYDSIGDILYYLKVEPGPLYRFL